jgi:hypothetical protein
MLFSLAYIQHMDTSTHCIFFFFFLRDVSLTCFCLLKMFASITWERCFSIHHMIASDIPIYNTINIDK